MDRLDVKRQQVLDALDNLKTFGRSEGLLAGHVMTAAPNCTPPETTVVDLVRLFHEKQSRHVLVTDATGQLVGVISDRDVIRAIGPEATPNLAALREIRAADIMSTDLVTVGPQTPLAHAVVLMLEQGINCLPVLHGPQLVGILTNTDLHIVLEILLQRLVQPVTKESMAAGVSRPQS
jgi:CBS domain-containing protein